MTGEGGMGQAKLAALFAVVIVAIPQASGIESSAR